jgi:hypothetical protein
MAGISFMENSQQQQQQHRGVTIQRYDLSRHDRDEIMLLIDPSVSPASLDHDEDGVEEDEKWSRRKIQVRGRFK